MQDFYACHKYSENVEALLRTRLTGITDFDMPYQFFDPFPACWRGE
jgi:hypothetical protein